MKFHAFALSLVPEARPSSNADFFCRALLQMMEHMRFYVNARYELRGGWRHEIFWLNYRSSPKPSSLLHATQLPGGGQ
jgi:hypothetical protein